ncbi:MAG: hypothetical protein LV481_11465 [Methylacidiphilales bacterium]|nr:hypothetical protein [Candidatus Methylacidiphilales bacterium]
MSLATPRKDKLPFAEVKASSAFMAEAQRLLVREIVSRSGEFISESNHQTFYHGRDWTYQREGREGFTTQTGHLQLHRQQITISVDRILANDMWVLPELILGFGEQTATSMTKKVESELTKVAEEVGNSTAVPQDRSMVDAFLEAIDKAYWSMDSKGRLYAPRIMLDEKSQRRFHTELATRREEFDRRLEEIRARKEPLARQAEEERLRKYDADE